MENESKLVEHLFRHEAGKITSVMAKIFGFSRLEEAEDIVQDTFIAAYETWKLKGIPENPTAWLYKVARNKFLNHVKRQNNYQRIISENKSVFPLEYTITAKIEEELQHIDDNQIQMLFALCHPSIPEDSQVALALKTLSGFSIEEIAKSFLTNKENIQKRLYRAREKIKEEKIELEIPNPDQMIVRLDRVLKCIYLLFSEGYYSNSEEIIIRKDLCLEAMRLCLLLIEYKTTNRPEVNALMALMCFHVSRFESRSNEYGELLTLEEQDKTLWNQELIETGNYFLTASASEEVFSDYHIEAMIAFYHTKEDSEEKWKMLLNLYNHLLKLKDNPIVAMNRAYIMSKAITIDEAILELHSLKGLEKNHLYHALLGKLYSGIDKTKSRSYFEKALSLANSESEKKLIQKKYLS